jgi:hypothetical protein
MEEKYFKGSIEKPIPYLVGLLRAIPTPVITLSP